MYFERKDTVLILIGTIPGWDLPPFAATSSARTGRRRKLSALLREADALDEATAMARTVSYSSLWID